MLTTIGLRQARAQERVPAWLWLGLALGPLVRFEHLALSFPAFFLLGLRQSRARLGVLVTAAVTLVLIGLASARLDRLGLGYLPSSIPVKSAVVKSSGHLATLAHNVTLHAHDLQGVVILLSVPLLLMLDWQRCGVERDLATFGVLAATAHILAGHSGWYNRYTAYIWGTLLIVGLALLPAELPRLRAFAARAALAPYPRADRATAPSPPALGRADHAAGLLEHL